MKEVITDLLTKFPETRNSDLLLCWKYHDEVDGIAGCNQNGIMAICQCDYTQRATNPATIIRMRAEIQNEDHDLLPTSDKVIRDRGLLRKKWYRDLGYGPENETKEPEGGIGR